MHELSPKRLAELEQKWIDKTITPEEAEEYFNWLGDEEVPVADHGSVDAGLRSRMLAQINNKAGIKTPGVITGKINFSKWIAAASVIVLISVGGYFWFNQHTNVEQFTQRVATINARPGSNKAILTLADGRRVVLEETANGQVAKEGSSAINKINGEVIYSALNDAPGAGAPAYNTMATPRGGQYTLTLSDGTKVWLNSATQIKYQSYFSGKDRVVELEGEAYFEVAKNARQPFYVRTKNMTVQVLGTHFNVNAYANENSSQTTLLEGSVKVNEKLLQPGQQAERAGENANIKINQQIDVQQVIAWQRGVFEFRRADIGAIARQISRWYDVDVKVETNRAVKLGGSISKRLPLSDILELLASAGIKYRQDQRVIILF